MPDFHSNLFFITAPHTHCFYPPGPQQLVLLQPDFLMHSYHYHQYFLSTDLSLHLPKLLQNEPKTCIKAIKLPAKLPVLFNKASYTKYASHNRTLSVLHDAQMCWSLSYCFYKSALKMTKKN